MRLRRSTRTDLILGVALTVLTWPFADFGLQPGLDPSWRIGLAMAADRGLDFGRDVVFTYGPLGFLDSPTLTSTGSFRLAIVYQLVLLIATSTLLVAALRRTFSLWMSAIVAYAVLALLVEGPSLVLAVVCAILVIRRATPGSWWLAALLGGFAGFELLTKLNIGISAFVVLLLALMSQPGRRRSLIGIYLGTAALTLVACWVLAGQSLGALPDYIRHGASVTAGYSSAMSIYDRDLAWQFVVAAVTAGLLAYSARLTFRDCAPRTQLWAYLMLAFVTFVLFKEGFVRLDTHPQLYFSGLFAVLPALGWGERLRGVATLATLVAGVALVAVLGAGKAGFTTPGSSVSGFAEALRLTVDSDRRDAEIGKARKSMTATYAVEPEILARIGDAEVAVEPKEIGVAFAYGLRWHPLPVFQDYQAYTSDLDDLNADAVASDSGPEVILRNLDGSIDGRLDAWDPPREKVEMLCHFGQEVASARWQLLRRVPNRCGADRKLSEVSVAPGSAIPVPSPGPGRMLTARVRGLGPTGLERVRALFYKPENRYAILNGNQFSRLISATAQDGLLISLPPELDFPGAFHLAPNPSQLAFAIGFGAQDGSRRITVTFFSRPVRAPAVAPTT